MAKSICLYPNRSQLKKLFGGRSWLYQFQELNTFDTCALWKDDFTADEDSNQMGSITNGTSAAVTGSVASTANGICRLTTGTDDNGYVGIFPGSDASLQNACAVGNNSPVIWVRLKVSAATTLKIEVGFTDADDDTGAVNVLATPSTTADDYAVWCYDTDDTGGLYWQGVSCVAGGTPAKVEPGLWLPTTAYEWMGVAIQGGAVKFMHADRYGNVNYESAWQAAAITADDALVPWIFVQNRAVSASRTVDIDYVLAYQRREATDDG